MSALERAQAALRDMMSPVDSSEREAELASLGAAVREVEEAGELLVALERHVEAAQVADEPGLALPGRLLLDVHNLLPYMMPHHGAQFEHPNEHADQQDDERDERMEADANGAGDETGLLQLDTWLSPRATGAGADASGAHTGHHAREARLTAGANDEELDDEEVQFELDKRLVPFTPLFYSHSFSFLPRFSRFIFLLK